MQQYTIIIFLFCCGLRTQYNINQNFLLCKETSQIYDLEHDCEYDEWCVIYTNILATFTMQNDTFNFLYTSQGKIVVYSVNGLIYTTECSIVAEITIYEKVESCSMDTLISIVKDGVKKDAFLTKKGIIRDKSTLFDCPTDGKITHFQNINKDFEILKKNNLVTITKRNEKNLRINFEHVSTFVDYYNALSENPIIKITKDSTCFFILLLLSLVALLDKKHMIKNLSKYLTCFFKRNLESRREFREVPTFLPSLPSAPNQQVVAIPSHYNNNNNTQQPSCDVYHNLYPAVSHDVTELPAKRVLRSKSAENISMRQQNQLFKCLLCPKVYKTQKGLSGHLALFHK